MAYTKRTKEQIKADNEARVKAIQESMTQRMLELMAQGPGQWLKPWESVGIPTNFTTGENYQGGNVFWLALLGASEFDGCNEWAGSGQAWKQGYRLIKNSKATYILRPNLYKVEEADGSEGFRLSGFSAVAVYNGTQFVNHETGEPFQSKAKRKALNPATRVAHVESFISNMGIPFKYGCDFAAYASKQDMGFMPDLEAFKDTAGAGAATLYYSTHLHECAHATGHKDRLNRELGNRFGSPKYAFEELIAELTSAMACAHLGIAKAETDTQHAAYLKNWSECLKEDSTAIVKASQHAAKALQFMLDCQG